MGDINVCTRMVTPLLEGEELRSRLKPRWGGIHSKSRMCAVGKCLNCWGHMGSGLIPERRWQERFGVMSGPPTVRVAHEVWAGLGDQCDQCS